MDCEQANGYNDCYLKISKQSKRKTMCLSSPAMEAQTGFFESTFVSQCGIFSLNFIFTANGCVRRRCRTQTRMCLCLSFSSTHAHACRHTRTQELPMHTRAHTQASELGWKQEESLQPLSPFDIHKVLGVSWGLGSDKFASLWIWRLTNPSDRLNFAKEKMRERLPSLRSAGRIFMVDLLF